MTSTRTGDVIGVYPFEALRTSLAEATEAIANADRTVVDDDAFAKLCDRQDEVVAHLAAHFPASADEAIFLLHILRDRMVEDFNPGVIAASNRDIVRGTIAYLSDAFPAATRNENSLVKTDWRKLLDEYRRLAIAENTVAHTYPDLENPPLSTVMDECRAIEERIAEAPIDGLESLVGKLALIWSGAEVSTGSPPSIALLTVLDFLAEQTGWDPFMVYDRDGEPVRFSEDEFAEAAALYSKKPDKNDDGPIAG